MCNGYKNGKMYVIFHGLWTKTRPSDQNESFAHTALCCTAHNEKTFKQHNERKKYGKMKTLLFFFFIKGVFRKGKRPTACRPFNCAHFQTLLSSHVQGYSNTMRKLNSIRIAISAGFHYKYGQSRSGRVRTWLRKYSLVFFFWQK